METLGILDRSVSNDVVRTKQARARRGSVSTRRDMKVLGASKEGAEFHFQLRLRYWKCAACPLHIGPRLAPQRVYS